MSENEAGAIATDLVDAIRIVLETSAEPLTVQKIRGQLPEPFNGIRPKELAETLQRQVAANVFLMCPKYRSGQDRYWNRSLREHARLLLRSALQDGPMPWPDMRRKCPKYLRHLAESVLNEELAKGTIHRHPPVSTRSGFRFALERVDVRSYAATELEGALARLAERGIALSDAREALMQLLHNAEWADDPRVERAPSAEMFATEIETWNSPTP